MATAKEALAKLMDLEGAIGACIVDSNSGMMLGSIGGGTGINLELAAAGKHRGRPRQAQDDEGAGAE